jgi:hypothetical protein
MIAMPWDEECPHCHRMVKDWFVEWCILPDQQEIGRQRLAIDCPWCQEPVVIKGMRAYAPPSGFTPAEPVRRDYHLADAWARQRYPDLSAFLQDPDPSESSRAAPFRRNDWPNVNVPDPSDSGLSP